MIVLQDVSSIMTDNNITKIISFYHICIFITNIFYAIFEQLSIKHLKSDGISTSV